MCFHLFFSSIPIFFFLVLIIVLAINDIEIMCFPVFLGSFSSKHFFISDYFLVVVFEVFVGYNVVVFEVFDWFLGEFRL